MSYGSRNDLHSLNLGVEGSLKVQKRAAGGALACAAIPYDPCLVKGRDAVAMSKAGV